MTRDHVELNFETLNQLKAKYKGEIAEGIAGKWIQATVKERPEVIFPTVEPAHVEHVWPSDVSRSWEGWLTVDENGETERNMWVPDFGFQLTVIGDGFEMDTTVLDESKLGQSSLDGTQLAVMEWVAQDDEYTILHADVDFHETTATLRVEELLPDGSRRSLTDVEEWVN